MTGIVDRCSSLLVVGALQEQQSILAGVSFVDPGKRHARLIYCSSILFEG